MDYQKLKSDIYGITNIKDICIEQREVLSDQGEIIVCNNTEYNFYMYITYNTSLYIATVRNYSIAHHLRGTGLGSKLYNIFEKYLKSQGFKEIQLHLVLTGAEKFWTKKGFKIIDHVWRKKI